MSFWNLERAIRTCPNVSRPSKGVVRAVQQLRCISTDDEIASSVLTEATAEIATSISVCLPIETLKVVLQTCIEHPSDLREGVITAIAAHAIPRLDIEDLVVLATDAEIVDRKLNAPILGATVKVLRGKGAKKLKSGLTSEEAANEIVKEISAGPWDADFAKAVISSDGFLSSASGNEMISKLVNSIFELEDTDLAVKVVVNPALTMRVRWVFVQHLIEKYSSADRAVELLSFVAKSRAVIVRQLRALRAVSGIHVIEALVGLDDTVVMKTCAETVVRMVRSLHSIALKRTIHWYATFPNRDAHFRKWLGANLSRQLGRMEGPRVRNFLSTVAVKADGHLVLDPIINSGEISCPLMFDALAQALMRPGLPTATVERIASRLVDSCDCNSTEKWDSLVLVLPAETLPCLALCTAERFPHQPQRASVVVERMRKILEGPGGENHRGPYTTAVARLSALGYSCDGWRDLVCPENPLAQVVGLSSKVTLARAQGGHRCEGLEGPLVTELNLQVDKEVAGQEWLGEFPPVLPCGDLHDAECNLVELMEVYSPHRLWFARRCLVAASMVASRELTSAPLVSFITRKSPTGEAHEICVRHDVGYVAAVVDLLATSFESGEKNEALWWSIFARLFDCSTTSERTLKILTEILDKMLPLESTQCAFRTLEKLALESFMDTESCRRSRWVAQSLHTIYHVAMRCGKNENSSWLEDRRLFIVHLIRTVSLDLCPDALLLVFECAMMFGASCQHLRCIAEAAVEGCEDADRQTMRWDLRRRMQGYENRGFIIEGLEAIESDTLPYWVHLSSDAVES